MPPSSSQLTGLALGLVPTQHSAGPVSKWQSLVPGTVPPLGAQSPSGTQMPVAFSQSGTPSGSATGMEHAAKHAAKPTTVTARARARLVRNHERGRRSMSVSLGATG